MNRTLKKITVHSVLWAMYFILNYTLARNYNIEFNLLFHIKTWGIQVVLFYINYLVLIPRLLLKNKLAKYLLFSALTLFLIYLVKLSVDEAHLRNARRDPLMFSKPVPPETRKREKDFFHSPGEMPLPRFKPGKKFFIRLHFNFFPLSSLLLVYLAGISIRITMKWLEDEKKKRLLENEKIANELTFLKQQINPHFLFNSLNTIYSLSMSKSDKTTGSILMLSSLLRYILYEGEKQHVSFGEEIKSLTDYIELQKLRVTDKVKIEFNINGGHGHLRIEPLLILPLVENAFKHGVDNANESFIKINITCLQQSVNIVVINKKTKSDKRNFVEEGGIGLKNIQRRLDLIYPGNHWFNITDDENLFTVELKINLKK